MFEEAVGYFALGEIPSTYRKVVKKFLRGLAIFRTTLLGEALLYSRFEVVTKFRKKILGT
jgi:hypothetical protein